MNAIFLRLTVWLGSECSSQAQPRTATTLLLPDRLHSQGPSGSPCWLALFGLPCCLGSCRWSFFLLLPDLHCERSNRSAATGAACTVPLPLQSMNLKDRGCNDIRQDLQQKILPCAEPIRDIQWLALGNLLPPYACFNREKSCTTLCSGQHLTSLP